ncbi:NAD(P)-dependent oxidoreductase [Micromonospora sp. NPDC049559]|uniref:NAD-dependent epimerase/dehydratase family protein n=1 Tax=Micromonospora sp. NPDC049559 TaxID=3155923 RepID=UPI003414553E
MTLNVLLVGASGFVGRAILATLLVRRDVRVWTLTRRPLPVPAVPAHRQRLAELTRPESLAGCCAGVDAVLHAASYVGSDAELAERVNHLGTRWLTREVVAAGVTRFVYVSVAAVYGSGPHRGPAEGEIEARPTSARSASRLRAEAYVLGAGGQVLRPHLVYGPEDRWFVPATAAMLAAAPGWIDGGAARTSVINVRDLARLAVALGTAATPPAQRVHHANHPEPVTIREIGLALAREFGIAVPDGSVDLAEARRWARRAGIPDRQLTLFAADHWYDSTRVWRVTGQTPGPRLPNDLAGSAEWYRPLLAGRDAAHAERRPHG